MRVVVLAGGLGTRLSEETERVPKPMVGIGGMPMLWHIMKVYEAADMRHFVVALGYKGEVVKRFFLDYRLMRADLSITTRTGDVAVSGDHHEDWTVDLVDTGLHTQTGGRLKRLAPYLGNSTFMLTYGDGVSDVNVNELLAFHRKNGKIATLTAVRPPARFGHMHFDGELITQFNEKPQTESGWINGGFFAFEPKILDLIPGDDAWLEREPLEKCAEMRELVAYKHQNFWQCMDTVRDRRLLEELWSSGKAPWRTAQTN